MKSPHLFCWLCTLVGLSLFAAGCRQAPCEQITCLNGGTCIEGNCDCPQGFTGATCESFESTEFLGTFTADYGDCLTVSPNHRVEIDISGGNDTTTQLRIFRLGDYACPSGELVVAASVTLNQLTIPAQTIDCGGVEYNFSGSGQLQGNVLTLNFTNSYAGNDDVCTATLEKEL